MLLERTAELDRVRSAVRTGARRSRGSTVLVRGGLGIGKSALLAAARAGLADEPTTVLWAGAGAGRPVAERLSQQARSGGRLSTSDSAGAVLDPLARHRTVAVFVDDIQWADEDSLHWLEEAAELAARRPVVLVLALLNGDPAADQPAVRRLLGGAGTVLRPGPLSPAATRQLAERYLTAGPDRQAERLHRESGGNPLLLRSMLLDEAPRSSGLTGGQRLRERIASALASLNEPAWRYLRATVMLNDPGQEELVGQLAGLDSVDTGAARRTLTGLGLLIDQDQPPLLRDLVCQLVVEAVDPEWYGRAQLRAAELLFTAGHPAERVAEHLFQAAPSDQAWVAEVLRNAVDGALARDDRASAVGYQRVALLNGAAGGAPRGRLLVQLAAVGTHTDRGTALRHLAQGVPLLTEPRERAAALARFPATLLDSSTHAVNALIQETISELAGTEHPDDWDRELSHQLQARAVLAGREDPAVLAQVVDRLPDWTDRPVDTQADQELVAALLFTGLLTGAVPAARIGALAARVMVVAPAWSPAEYPMVGLVAASAMVVEETGGLDDWLESALAYPGRHGWPTTGSLLLALRACIAVQAGHTDLARMHVEQALGLLPSGTTDDWVCAGALLTVAVTLPDPALRQRILAACPVSGEPGDVLVAIQRDTVRGALLASHDPAGAIRVLEQAERRLEWHGWHNPALFRSGQLTAELLSRTGDSAAAVILIERQCELARTFGAAGTLARILRIWARLVDGPQRMRLLDEAVAVCERSANTLALTKSLLARGSAVHAVDWRPAVADLQRGQRMAEQAGYPRLAGVARLALHREHERAVPGMATLSRSERTVASLAARGRTNPEIAAELGISQRAVEKHLTNCYRKLRVANRAALRFALQPVLGSGQ